MTLEYEFKIIHGSTSGCEKKLNQWRQDYGIEIKSMSTIPKTPNRGSLKSLFEIETVVILLTRWKKQEPRE